MQHATQAQPSASPTRIPAGATASVAELDALLDQAQERMADFPDRPELIRRVNALEASLAMLIVRVQVLEQDLADRDRETARRRSA
jgi:hypothetical protein